MVAAIAVNPWWSVWNVVARIKDTLLGAFRQLLRPLVRTLLRHGVSYSEFAETSKSVFVEVAEADFLRNAQLPDNPTQLSLLTGISRTEVEQVREELARGSKPSTANLNRIGRILAGWHQDPDFTGPYGLPLELSRYGSGNTLEELVRRYGGGVSTAASLAELQQVGVVAEGKSGRVRVLTRSYIPNQEDPASFQFFGVALRDLAETLDINLNSDSDAGYFERRVWTPAGVLMTDLPEFDALVHQRGQQFLETLDNYLTAKETEAEHFAPDQKIKVGVGVYMFSDAHRSIRED
jgi:hypothetical protein